MYSVVDYYADMGQIGQDCALRDYNVDEMELDKVTKVIGYHPRFLNHFLRTQNFIMNGDGPLPYDYRYYLAIIAAARHQCPYLVKMYEKEFINQGGNPKWLNGLDHIPPKLRAIYEINKILAHRPWLLRKEHIEKLTKGANSWSLSEVVHAMVLLSHFHSLSSFVFSCGLTQKLDGLHSPTVKTPPSMLPTQKQQQQQQQPIINNGDDDDTKENNKHSELGDIYINGFNNNNNVLEKDNNIVVQMCNNNTAIFDIPSSNSNSNSNSSSGSNSNSSTNTVVLTNPEFASLLNGPSSAAASPTRHTANGGTGGNNVVPKPPNVTVAALMERMKVLSQQQPSACSEAELSNRFKSVEMQTAELPATVSEANVEVPPIISQYIDDPGFTYQDFARRGSETIPNTFRIQDYSWDDHGYSLVDGLYSDVGTLLDQKFRAAYNLTYFTMGGIQNVDTSKFRRAIWNYIQCIFGIRHDDYDYGEVNQLLDRPLKMFIKTACCFPERITTKDYESVLVQLQDSEKVHVNLMIMEARNQAELLYALREIMRYMT